MKCGFVLPEVPVVSGCCPQSTKNVELQRKRVLQEMGSMLRVQHHPHAVRLLDAFEDERSYQIVMPVLKGIGQFVWVAASHCQSNQRQADSAIGQPASSHVWALLSSRAAIVRVQWCSRWQL
jgi:hypothetical protein